MAYAFLASHCFSPSDILFPLSLWNQQMMYPQAISHGVSIGILPGVSSTGYIGLSFSTHGFLPTSTERADIYTSRIPAVAQRQVPRFSVGSL